MKVCLVYPHLPPTVDGVGEYTCRLGHELARQGVEVTVLAARAVSGTCLRDDVPCPVRLEHTISRWGVRGIPEIVNAVRETACDVVSIQYTPSAYARRGFGIGMSLLPRVLRSRLPCKVSVTVHEPWIPFAGWPHRWAIASWQRLATAHMACACHSAIVTSERRRRQLQRLVFPGGRNIAMVPVGSTIPVVESDRAAIRQGLGIGDEETLFALFGTVKARRDYAAVYRSLRAVVADGVPCRLVSIGDIGRPQCLASLGRLESDLGLKGRISWTGFRDAETVSGLLRAADVFLMPDRLGASTRQTSLMAALAHGLPVVAWRGPETDPLLERSGAILFAPAGDEKGLVSGMKASALAPDVRQCMGERARALYDQQFAWPRIAERALKAWARG